MKIIILALLALAVSPVQAQEKHDHEHEQKAAGPNGGRIIHSTDPHFEFFVTPGRKLQITFLDEANKAIPATTQTITANGGDRSSPTHFTFTKSGEVLLSDKVLPGGNNTPLILQIKASADSKTITERFNVNLADCAECKHKEYACICEHDH